jgi:L-glutamine---4-(methylsulfanyl)-2-oxobutanoate aminotransferase
LLVALKWEWTSRDEKYRLRSGFISSKMPATATRLSRFSESVIRGMTRLANQHGAINLAQGFPDFDPPEELLAALERATRGPHHQYAVTWGAPRFRQALARKISRFTGLAVDPDTQLVVTCGSTEAMMVAMMTACNPGDKVVVFSPFYENYAADAILSGAEPIYVPLHAPDFHFDSDELARAFAQKPKAIIVCNPSNPTGKVFTRAELLEILKLAEQHDAFVITDEPYEHLVYAPYEHVYCAALPGAFERVITCNSLSKTYSITGWRLGYVHAAPAVIAQARKVHDFLTVGAAAPLQEAAVAGLELPDSYYIGLRESYAQKRDLFLGYLRQAGLSFTEPQGAYYVMLDVSPLGFASDTEAAEWFVREIGVAGVPGSSFFREPENRFIRFHFAKKEETLHAAGQRLLKLASKSR